MLTSQDLDQISKILQSSELRIIHHLEIYIDKKLDQKLSMYTQQIKEYIDTLHLSHDTWLRDHDKRIEKLEDSNYYVRDQKRKE